MSPSFHPVISQSSERLLQSTARNHELATATPKEDKGKRKTPAKDEVNEFDKAYLNLLQKKLNTDADTHFSLNIVENLNNLHRKKNLAKRKIMTVLIEMCED